MTTAAQQIEIPLSKQKITLMFLGSLIFVAIGLWFVISPPKIENSFWQNPTTMLISGYAAITFFGLCAYFLVRKLSDNKPGLIISDEGLIDNSSAIAVGQILWSEIEDISVIEIHRQKLIMLEVKNPQDFIDKETNKFKKKMMTINYRMYGTPLSINANGLDISFEELLSTLNHKLNDSQ